MDYLLNPERNSANQKSHVRSENNSRQQYKLNPEKRRLSFADFHHEITMNTGQVMSDPQQHRFGKEADEDELVKYMSKLPSYLQRDQNSKEKALNVGVLDWRLLEKWQCGQKQTVPCRINRYSPSSSNTSSSLSTDESSTHSSRGHSCSPTRQRSHRPSLLSHLSSSMMEGPSQSVEPIGERKKSALSRDSNRSENSVAGAPALFNKLSDNLSVGTAQTQLPNSGNVEHNNGLLFAKGSRESRYSRVCQRSFSEGCKKASQAEVNSNVPYSCPLFSVVESKESQMQKLNSVAVNCPSGSLKSVSQPPKRAAQAQPMFSASIEHPKFSDQKPKKVTAERLRSISPFQRFTGGLSKSLSKNLSPNDGAVNSRERSSPLRRLLDPLLKPKVETGSSRSVECSGCMSSEHVSMARSTARVKLGMTGCKKTSVNEYAMGKKHGPSSAVQALLRVTVKNNLPLYTFAVNDESNNNILAATAKILDAEKSGSFGSVYTFFAIRDAKRNKGKSQDYVSNPVAQMKVSGSGSSDSRDFVLFSVDLRQADDQSSEFQPNDELAAIVVRFPKKDNSNRDSISTTVVLPSDVHSLPSKGGPSSLIERWISGGSCDCGGWDLGCKLRTLTNLKKSSSSMDRVELFSQGGLQEQERVFSLSPFKEGIYSVEFHSSLSVLQAFSVCTALLDSRKQCDILESRDSVEEKSLGEPSLVQNGGTSGPSRTEGEGSRYVSYPPHSPVGRV